MIFEMDIFGNKLYSIGDDRSIRIFDIESAKELNVAYGHESRIRALKVLSDDRIFSAGDEICLWKWIGSSLKLIEKYEVGIGKIVHLNIFDNLLLASSMNGAMVTVQIKERLWEPIKIPAFEDYVIRAFIKILNGTYFFVDDQKHLYFTTKHTVIKRFIENQKIRFDSLRLSKSGKYAAAASDNKVFMIETSTKKYCTFVVEDVFGGEFFIDDELIVIAKNGKGIAFSMKDNVFIKKSTCVSRGLPIKCGLAVDNFYLFGTTKGYVIAYQKSDLLKEAFSFKVSAKSEPVTDISVISSQIYILTRDGKCSVCQKQNDKYEIIDSYTTAEKPTAFLSIENEHYIWGFRASEFIFIPLRYLNPLAVYECGGGHRISNVYPVFDEKKNFYGIRYEHIIRGEFKIVEMEISKIQNVVGPFHQSNIYGITMINEGHSIITAGIDTKILLCNIDTNGRFCPRWHSSAHLSSIHSLDSTKLRNGTEFVATCGGTSEIRIWKIGENSLYQCGHFTCKPDYRYVSIKIRQSLEDENILYIFAACSIRQIHIFSFNISIGKIEKLLSYQNSEPSTFSKIAVSSDLLTIYAASTSGTVTALSWSPGSKEPALIQKVEAFDSGLSAICSVNLNDTNLSKNVCAVGCEGGDFALVDFETESVVLKSLHPHYSTVTDICFSFCENHWTLGTIATDCQIIISYFGITNDGNLEIVNTKYFNTNVGDPIAILPIDNSSNYLIVGQGIDFVKNI
jgi:WD40 repeat protein